MCNCDYVPCLCDKYGTPSDQDEEGREKPSPMEEDLARYMSDIYSQEGVP